MICYLSRNYKGISGAGNKAKTDIEQIMSASGFKNAGMKQTTYTNSVLAFLFTLLGVLKLPFGLHTSDCLILQYPFKKYFTLVCKIAHLRKVKVIVVIHDLGSFRRKKLTITKEIKRLNNADYIIAHNASMKNFLEENGCHALIGKLEIFDYLSDIPIPQITKEASAYSVLYAGGLSYRKNRFLYDMGTHIHSYSFYLYGNGFELEKAKGQRYLHYMGFIPSDKLIEQAKGDFGLVWDGASIDACTGNFGEYLRYNNPHKTSLYLRCGLPVIIWKQAALAPFIEKNGVGFCIESLEDIDRILSSMSRDEYLHMRMKAHSIGEQINSGYFIQKALKQALEQLNYKSDSNS